MTPAGVAGVGEAFMLYAETIRPDEAACAASLDALSSCVAGTHRETPQVATYHFRRSGPVTRSVQQRWPGAVATESVELYLTIDGFLRHLTTPEFRDGLRAVYNVPRLGISIWWIGALPPSAVLDGIYKSDGHARPLATLRADLFDLDTASAADPSSTVLVSATVDLADGRAGITALERLRGDINAISFIAFFHPRRTDELRVIATVPISPTQTEGTVSSAFGALAAIASADGRSAHVDLQAPDAGGVDVATLRAGFAGAGYEVQRATGQRGYILHAEAAEVAR